MQIQGLHHLTAETQADTITETSGQQDYNSKNENVNVVCHVVPRGYVYTHTHTHTHIYIYIYIKEEALNHNTNFRQS